MTSVIEAPHYRETVAKLKQDRIIIDMAEGLIWNNRRGECVHDDGTPKFEFMLSANREYAEHRNGQIGFHIGGPAKALLSIIDERCTAAEELVKHDCDEISEKAKKSARKLLERWAA